MIDISILANIFRVVCCPECKDTKTLQLSDINDEKKGLARLLKLQCTSCLYTKTFFTAKQLGTSEKGGRKSFDVNVRTVYASRQIGAGYEQIKKFCSYLNMPSPMLSNNYTKISDKLRVSAKKVAEKSMAAAASELRGEAPTADVGVSVDGTWQRKGYSSMNGVITAISVDNGKVLDTAILTKNCKACVRMRSAEPETYQAWYEKHQTARSIMKALLQQWKLQVQRRCLKHLWKTTISITRLFMAMVILRPIQQSKTCMGQRSQLQNMSASGTTRKGLVPECAN